MFVSASAVGALRLNNLFQRHLITALLKGVLILSTSTY